MNHEMRRKDRAVAESETRELLSHGIYGVLGTIGEDGYPYGVPVNYVCDENAIYFHCAKNCGRKLENLAFSWKACFTVVNSSEVLADKFAMKYESVIVSGTVSEVTENKEAVFQKFLEKYSAAFMEAGNAYITAAKDKAAVYALVIEDISGKARR